MAAPAFVTASAGTTDNVGAWTHTSAAPGAAGRLLIVHVLQDGTSTGADQPDITSVTNAENLAGTDNVLTKIGVWAVGAGTEAYQHLWIGRSLGTSAMVITGSNAGGDDVYVRVYEFSGASTATTIERVIENVTRGATVNGVGSSDTVADTGVTTLGPDRLALNFIAANDDAPAAELTAMTGETGGDWTYPTAAYGTSTGSDGTIALVAASLTAAGTINGGTDSITSTPWGVVGFALLPSGAAVYTGSVVNPTTFGAVTNSVKKITGQASLVATAGIVANGIATSPTRGVVSWASFETPVPVVQGQVDNVETFTAVSSGVTKRYGLVQSPFTVTPVVQGIVDAKAASATPVTFDTVTNGVRVVYGVAAFTVDLAILTAGGAPGGRVDLVETFDTVTSGVTTSHGTVDSPFTLTTATTGVRTVYGATSLAVTSDTVTDGDLLNYAKVSWAALEIPLEAAVSGAVSLDLTGGISTNGVRTVYGKVDNPTTFTVVTNGSAGAGARVSLEETFDTVAAAIVGARSAVDLTETLSTVTSARMTVIGAASLGVTAAITTGSKRTVYGAVAVPETIEIVTTAASAGAGSVSFPVTVGITSSGRVGARSSVSLTVTATTVTDSLRTVVGNVVAPFAFTVATAQRVDMVGRVALPVTADITTGQNVTARAAVALPISFNITSSGGASGFVTAAVSLQITHSTTTTGLTTRYGSVVYPTTFTTVTAPRVSTTSSSSLTITAAVAANGIRTAYAATSLPIQVGIETRGNLAGSAAGRCSLDVTAEIVTSPWLLARAQVGLPIVLTATTGAKQVAFAQVDVPLVFNIKSGNPIYSSGTNGHIALGRPGTARRWTNGRIANARVRTGSIA